jgi:hypothetical protein
MRGCDCKGCVHYTWAVACDRACCRYRSLIAGDLACSLQVHVRRITWVCIFGAHFGSRWT